MDYEKKYKDALAWIRSLHPTMKGEDKKDAERYFPELKESEDERIIKALKEGFKYYQLFNPTFGGVPCTEIVNWLEKQGEQKPVDNVEPKYVPKFHEGDWVACNSDNLRAPLRIVSVSDTEYRVEDVRGVPGRPMREYLDRHYHLWTIQDAKCGDVLAGEYDDCKKPWVGIFKCISENRPQTQFDSYCFITSSRHEFITPDSCDFCNRCKGHTIRYTKPATKEQRGVLFQKMNEAGYEWDAKRKKLSPLSKSEVTKMDGQEQKPARNEEDLWMIDVLCSIIRENYFDGFYKTTPKGNIGKNAIRSEEIITWLESLKQRFTWKPSEEQMLQLGWVAEQNKDNIIGKELMTLYNDLKKLSWE